MSVWVALLRGINVGGNNIIPMAALAETFRGLGFDDVKTFIASGNVLFRTSAKAKADARALEKRIERAIEKAHGCAVKVVVRSRDELRAFAKRLPAAWKKPSAAKRHYVMFLRHDVDAKDVVAKVKVNAEMEELVYVPGALLLSATKAKITRSHVAKIMTTPLYREVTARNLSTTMKICELAETLGEEP